MKVALSKLWMPIFKSIYVEQALTFDRGTVCNDQILKVIYIEIPFAACGRNDIKFILHRNFHATRS